MVSFDFVLWIGLIGGKLATSIPHKPLSDGDSLALIPPQTGGDPTGPTDGGLAHFSYPRAASNEALQPRAAPACGEVSVFFTGLPPYHPLVIEQGFDPAKVDAGIREDSANIRKAGYNLRTVLMGPEQSMSVLDGRLQGIAWGVNGIGFGVRGSNRDDLTVRLKDTIKTFHTCAPSAPVVFDHSFTTGLWAIQQELPLAGNCTNSPGQDLGYETYCDICNTTSKA
ncbi:MAG: hypothetical protein M1820_005288 [Bogoriella megaspora]|nr:MAG: hypothetical protein M1820_005288 [Bogoriella megaspora]